MKSVLSYAAAAAALISATAFAQSEAPPRGHSKAEFLRTYDTDLDGVVSRAEFDAQRRQTYTRTDSDGDGSLSEAEYVGEYTARLDADLAATRTRQLDQARVRFDVMDADRNERMTRAEYDASGARNFTRLDTNGDGRVDDRDAADRY